MHHRPKNLGKKKAEMQKKAKMQKKAENARSISKLMQKKGINAKNTFLGRKIGRKYIFNFEIHTKKYQKGKKESTFILIFFRFYIPCACFCISNLKIHIKKDKNAKKKHKIFFKLQK